MLPGAPAPAPLGAARRVAPRVALGGGRSVRKGVVWAALPVRSPFSWYKKTGTGL